MGLDKECSSAHGTRDKLRELTAFYQGHRMESNYPPGNRSLSPTRLDWGAEGLNPFRE